MRTLTEHLRQPLYTIINTLHYGILEVEGQRLHRSLTTMIGEASESITHHSKQGDFIITRSFQDGKHGFRVIAVPSNPVDAERIERANKQLAEYDTQNPEAVWAVKPFWANA